MKTLTIENFSCVDEASLELSRMTALIGPQASGKSVISKLSYFFLTQIKAPFDFSLEERTLEAFKAEVAREFNEWFPPGTWGKKQFLINFEAGPITTRITRARSKRGTSKRIEVAFSDFFVERFLDLQKNVHQALAGTGRRRRKDVRREAVDFSALWNIQSTATDEMRKALGSDFIDDQTFIPAGRSFFTSISKAVSAFERSEILDPVTMQFGRLYAHLIDRMPFDDWSKRHGRRLDRRRELMQNIFGGTIRVTRNREYVETSDGRTVPISLLSSGQQELLPLFRALDFLSERRGSQLIYIEEPEAHLFPSAQKELVEYLASIVAPSKSTINMVLTTHSPYVLTVLNNLLKAGILASSPEGGGIADQIAKAVRRDTWLMPGSTRAYSIQDRKLISIIGDDGLIDAAYLDDISSEIAREFSALLKIESEHGHSSLPTV